MASKNATILEAAIFLLKEAIEVLHNRIEYEDGEEGSGLDVAVYEDIAYALARSESTLIELQQIKLRK